MSGEDKVTEQKIWLAKMFFQMEGMMLSLKLYIII